MTVVKLTGGVTLKIAMDAERLTKLLADGKQTMVLLTDSDGNKVALNPDHVVYVDGADER